jgi:hypothetical protein
MKLVQGIRCLLIFAVACSFCDAQSPFEEAITPTQLAALVQSLPNEQIYSIRLFREESNNRLSAELLVAGGHKGWQVQVVSPRAATGYSISWKSSWLADAFAVSSPQALGTYGLGNEEAVTFSGCAAHECPDIFSVLLYVPSRHRAFTATCENGQTSYSFPRASADSQYVEPLNELLRDKTGSDKACSKEVQESK